MAGCYILLQTGGRLEKVGSPGFLIYTDCTPTPDVEEENTPGFPHKDASVIFFENRTRELQEQLAKQEQSVIELQLEAQDVRVRELELLDAQDKQSRKQLAALQAEYIRLQSLIEAELMFREIYAAALLTYRNNQALLVLSMSMPFLNIMEGSKLIN